MGLKKHVPNLITSLNLLSGSIAVIFAVQGNLVLAAIFVAAGIFFDFFDGLAARALDVKSEVGLQLDSLADVVTSGVVPGIVMYQLIIKALPSSGSLSTDRTYLMFEGSILKHGMPEELAEDEMVRKVYLGQNFELRKKKIFN